MAIQGGGAVVWSKHKSSFPYVTGMLPIFLSWVISPLCSGLLTILLFGTLRTLVLRHANCFKRAALVRLWVLATRSDLTSS